MYIRSMNSKGGTIGRANETSPGGEIRRWSVSAWRLPRPSHNASPSCIVPLHETRGAGGEARRDETRATGVHKNSMREGWWAREEWN